LFIPLLAASLYFYVQNRETGNVEPTVNYCEIQAAIGARSSFTLPDNTGVWLNSGSRIRYPDRFTGKERTIYLEGEAYFEVTSSVEHPFVVNTPAMQVRATGTKFHVADFEDNPVKEISLLSGKVAIGTTDTNRQTTRLLDLEPGQHVEYGVTDRSTQVTEGDMYKYYAWKDNKMVFRNDLMSDVVKRISQLYGVEIELQGEELKKYRYRATFEDESLYEILKLLQLSAPINFREVKRKQQADGTFTRPKIVIYPVKVTK
jgi:ferric-dicitrate binding protein FerR (iron transport regulator)